ncbi:MAG: diguanylate cyclase [Pseudomonadota bacterium]
MTDPAARVLIVDDEANNRKLLEAMLTPEGYGTYSASSGEEALILAAEQQPDLILLDIMMPGMDGFQVASQLKDNPATMTIPIIMLTSLDDRHSKLVGLHAGADAFLTKPVDRAELKIRMRNLLRVKSYSKDLERRVRQREAELQQERAHLESVSERTAELSTANDELKKQAEELARHNQRITLFSRMNDGLQACSSEAEAYALIADTTAQLFPDDYGAIFALSPAGDRMETAAVWGIRKRTYINFAPDECWGYRRGRGYLATGHEKRCAHVDEDCMYACLPLLIDEEIHGSLHIRDGSEITEANEQRMREKYQLCKELVGHTELGIANLKQRIALLDSAIRDPLTALFNRRYLDEALAQEIIRIQRNKLELAVIMIDIDHFKNFNDTFGHDSGDAVLRELGIFLAKHVRGSDIACRYGGEEFTLVLSPSTVEGACQRAEKIREDVKLLHIHHGDQDIGPVTLSLGIAMFPEHATDKDGIIKAADVALYQAKENGRDRVVVFTCQH